MKLIYIGDHFYIESGTMISSIYTEDGFRSDWGHVQSALRHGEKVEIRPATTKEREQYEVLLAKYKKERKARAAPTV